MLPIIGGTSAHQSSVQSDDFVPLSFRCLDTYDSSPLYWRGGDFKNQLLEIGFNSTTGAVCKVTIPLLGIVQREPAPSLTVVDIREKCVPVADLAIWPDRSDINYLERYIDEYCNFKVFLEKDKYSMILENTRVIDVVYVIGSMTFGTKKEFGKEVLSLVSFTG